MLSSLVPPLGLEHRVLVAIVAKLIDEALSLPGLQQTTTFGHVSSSRTRARTARWKSSMIRPHADNRSTTSSMRNKVPS